MINVVRQSLKDSYFTTAFLVFNLWSGGRMSGMVSCKKFVVPSVLWTLRTVYDRTLKQIGGAQKDDCMIILDRDDLVFAQLRQCAAYGFGG